MQKDFFWLFPYLKHSDYSLGWAESSEFICAGPNFQREKIVLIYAHGVICIFKMLGGGPGSVSP